MIDNNAPQPQEFDLLLDRLKMIADTLPAAVIIHRVTDLAVLYMNALGLDRLGITMDELKNLNKEEYYYRFFNTEDSDDYVPKIMRIMESNTDVNVSYFQQVRNQQNQEWQVFASNTKIFSRNENGEPTHLITISSQVDPVNHITTKVNRLMDELCFLRINNPLFSKLTKREKEVLTCIALGMNSGEISDQLFISSATADTHRRNIRTKLSLKNNYDTVKFAQAYDLV